MRLACGVVFSHRPESRSGYCRDVHQRSFRKGTAPVAHTVVNTRGATPVTQTVAETVAETVAKPVAKPVAESVIKATSEVTAPRRPRHRLALKRAGLPPEAVPKLALLPPEVSGIPLVPQCCVGVFCAPTLYLVEVNITCQHTLLLRVLCWVGCV